MLATIRFASILLPVISFAACAPTPAPMARVGESETPVVKPAPDEGPVRAERIPVAFGDVKRLATLLERALVESPNRGAVRAVLVDERSGELVVFGTESGIARARAFLSPGIAENAGAEEVEVINLQHADVQTVAHVIERIVHGRVRVVPDPPLNALVVSGDAESRARVKKLAAELDVDGRNAKAPTN